MQRAIRAPTALVLEDEPRYREFLADVLRGMECLPLLAATASEAARIVRANPPDLMLLDLNLPLVDGITFLEEFRRTCPDSPVVIITGFGDLESARKAIRLGVTEFLTKPCDLGEIELAIDRARRRLPWLRGAMKESPPEDGPGSAVTAEVRPLEAVERDAIIDALKQSRGNRSEAARRLGISRRSLYNKIEEFRGQGHDVP